MKNSRTDCKPSKRIPSLAESDRPIYKARQQSLSKSSICRLRWSSASKYVKKLQEILKRTSLAYSISRWNSPSTNEIHRSRVMVAPTAVTRFSTSRTNWLKGKTLSLSSKRMLSREIQVFNSSLIRLHSKVASNHFYLASKIKNERPLFPVLFH